MARCYRIVRNMAHRSKNDKTLREIEGIYNWLDDAIQKAWSFQLYPLDDGTIRLYDRDTPDSEIFSDISGEFAVGAIAVVV